PAALFTDKVWRIRRPPADPDEVAEIAAMLARAERPLIIAGGGVVYSEATAELERLAAAAGAPVAETFAGKGAVQQPAWWQHVGKEAAAWARVRAEAIDPHTPFDVAALPADSDVVPDTDAVLTQGQLIGLLQENARPGDVIIAAAGGPPGDLQKVWDA